MWDKSLMEPNQTDAGRSPYARVIEQWMAEERVSRRQLEARADVGESYVRDILNGRNKNPAMMAMTKLVAALGKSMLDLQRAVDPKMKGPGERLRLAREFLKLSTPAFSAMFGIPEEDLEAYEQSRAHIPPELILSVKAKCGISSDWLLDGSEGSLSKDFVDWLAAQAA